MFGKNSPLGMTTLSNLYSGENIRIGVFLLLAGILLGSCNSDHKRLHDMIHEAEDIHKESGEVEKEILASLRRSQDLSLSKKDSMALVQIESRLRRWQEDRGSIEMGHDHGEGDDHNHDHDHSHNGLELLPDDLVLVQKEFKDSVLTIKKDLESLLGSSGTH